MHRSRGDHPERVWKGGKRREPKVDVWAVSEFLFFKIIYFIFLELF